MGRALSCQECRVRDQASCKALSGTERSALAKFGHCRVLRRGETLIRAGDENTYCCNLIEGILKVSMFDEDGKEHVLSVIHSAGFAGELFDPVARHDVIAVTECTVCVIPRVHYEQAIRLSPAFGCQHCRRSSQELVETRSLLAAVTSPSAMRRVSRYLIAIYENRTSADRELDLMLTRGEIASMLGLTIGSVSRQLTKLERAKIINRKGTRKVQIADADRLRDLAQGVQVDALLQR